MQGDVVQIYSIWGTKAVEYSYDAWGNCTVVSENDNYPGLAETNPIRYRGYVYDFETGFYYLNSRYYDPQVKRFINADDASLLGVNNNFISLNLYAYCGNNPVVRQDDTGDAWETIWDALSLASSVVEVAVNSYDPWAWIGLAGDAADLLIPFIGGIGEKSLLEKQSTFFESDYSDANINRMKRGLAPQYDDGDGLYSMELHHMLGKMVIITICFLK